MSANPALAALADLLTLIATGALAGQTASVCRDAEGRAVFSDQGCPEDTSNLGRGYLPSAQGYSGRQSIDTDVLNNYEQRYGTGRSWEWQSAPAGGR